MAVFLDLFVQIPTIAPFAKGLGASPALGGFIVASYFLTNLIGNLGAGYILDKWGRRLPIVFGLAITIVSVFSYTIVQTPEQLFAVRAIHGAGAAVLAPGAFTMIGDRAPVDGLGRAMGLTGALIAGAALVGFPAAGILRHWWSADAVFYFDSAFLLMTLVTFLIIARDHHAPTEPEASRPRPARMGPASIHPALWSAYAAVLAIAVGIGVLVAYLPLVVESEGVIATRTGNGFGIYAFVAMLVMASPLTRPSDRINRFGPMIVGLVVVAVALAILGIYSKYVGVVIGMAVFGFGYGIVFPAAAAVVIGTAGADRRGMAFGVFYAVYSLGVVVGNSVSGLLAERSDDYVGLPFLVAAVVVIAAVPIVEVMRRTAVGHPPSPGRV